MDGWVGGWVGGWVDGWMGGWMDGWVGGWVGAHLRNIWHNWDCTMAFGTISMVFCTIVRLFGPILYQMPFKHLAHYGHLRAVVQPANITNIKKFLLPKFINQNKQFG